MNGKKMTEDEQKQAAAAKSLDYVENGMTIGLGTGSCAAKMVDLLGVRVKEGLDITGIPTSDATAQQARALGIKIVGFDQTVKIDLTIDGTDEVDDQKRLIKGGGGAHLREKIVASMSHKMIVIAEAKKMVKTLGAFKLPVEIIPFAAPALAPKLEAMGCIAHLRKHADGSEFRTDENNLIFDCAFSAIENPQQLALNLSVLPGVVEHGLFIDMADIVIIGTNEGVRIFE